MKKINFILSLFAALVITSYASARDQIKIVGSSTVYPYATVVAEKFGKGGKFKTPVIESTGTGGGMKLFCAGVGTQHPDITNASRAIKSKEKALCAKNGVKDIVEITQALLRFRQGGFIPIYSDEEDEPLEHNRTANYY